MTEPRFRIFDGYIICSAGCIWTTFQKISAVPGLAREDAYQRLVPVPSDSAEQILIAAFIDAESRRVTDAMGTVHREIDLIQEFGTRLIADVVTGKLDVRAAAKTLPEAIDLAPVRESDEIEEIDEFDEPKGAEDEEVAA